MNALRRGGCTAIELDHVILAVNDRVRSVEFYTRIVGLEDGGEDGPFAMLRLNASAVILLAARETSGGEHLAFAMSQPEFEETFRRVAESGIPFGHSFDSVGSMRGPGDESGARGMGKAVYFWDPDRHLVEIRHYEAT